MLDRHLIEDALRPVTPTPIAHYTRIGNLCHFIPAGKAGWGSAWATPVQFLNDRMELSLGLEVLSAEAKQSPQVTQSVRDAIEDLLTTAGSMETDAFQMSFSGNPDELGQWRGYAANGMGCSLITDTLAVKGVADVAGWVIYDPQEQTAFARQMLDRVSTVNDPVVMQQVLVAAASFMKHEGFRPEQEFRLLKFPDPQEVRFRETGDRLVPYIDFLQQTTALPIQQIIIGPGWQLARLKTAEWARNHVVQGIYRLLTARGLHGTTSILASRIPYDPK